MVRVKLTSYELASYCQLLTVEVIPTTLGAAEEGSLSTTEGISAQLERDPDPKMTDGINQMFTDFFGLYALDDINKDPLIFNRTSVRSFRKRRCEVSPLSCKTTRIFISPASQYTHIDARLAALAIFQHPLDGLESFLTEGRGRRRLLGHQGFWRYTHAASTSATLRGIFIRKNCCVRPLPAADVDASPRSHQFCPHIARARGRTWKIRCAGCRFVVHRSWFGDGWTTRQ